MAEDEVNLEFPKVQVQSNSPLFKAFFTESDNQNMLTAVNSISPEVLFIGMTPPKQEKWAFEYKNMFRLERFAL